MHPVHTSHLGSSTWLVGSGPVPARCFPGAHEAHSLHSSKCARRSVFGVALADSHSVVLNSQNLHMCAKYFLRCKATTQLAERYRCVPAYPEELQATDRATTMQRSVHANALGTCQIFQDALHAKGTERAWHGVGSVDNGHFDVRYPLSAIWRSSRNDDVEVGGKDHEPWLHLLLRVCPPCFIHSRR